MRGYGDSLSLVSRLGEYVVLRVDGTLPGIGSKVMVKGFSGKVVDVIGPVSGPYVVARNTGK